jgi:hypothetical protein
MHYVLSAAYLATEYLCILHVRYVVPVEGTVVRQVATNGLMW